MNNVFNFSRFIKLLKTEILINKKYYAIFPLLIIFGISFGYYMTTVFNPTPIEYYISGYVDFIFNLIFAIVLVAPLVFYINLYDSKKDVARMLFPASQLEKVLAAVIQISFLLPVLLLIIAILLFLFIRLIKFPYLTIDYKDIMTTIFTTIQLQSILFLAVFSLKNNKIIKIIAGAIAFFIILAIFGSIIAVIGPSIKMVQFFETIYDCRYTIQSILERLWYVLVPILPWSLAYFQHKRMQI